MSVEKNKGLDPQSDKYDGVLLSREHHDVDGDHHMIKDADEIVTRIAFNEKMINVTTDKADGPVGSEGTNLAGIQRSLNTSAQNHMTVTV